MWFGAAAAGRVRGSMTTPEVVLLAVSMAIDAFAGCLAAGTGFVVYWQPDTAGAPDAIIATRVSCHTLPGDEACWRVRWVRRIPG